MGAWRVMVATGAVLAALAFPVEVGAVDGDMSTGGSVFDSPPAGASDASSFRLAATEVPATLVQVIRTSRFTPGSPDPSGVTYRPGADRLTIVDSEVDETTGAGYHGVNMWELTRTGTVTDTGTTLPYNDEPTGVGHDPGTNTLFISSDDGDRIHVLRPGSDNRFGTPDDVVSVIYMGGFGVEDAEDPEFDVVTGDLFFMDGINTDVYRIDPVDGTFGNANDVVTHFDVGVHGAKDVEALTSDPAAGTLLFGDRTNGTIYEITKSGGLVRTIDASDIAGLDLISGLGRAPASDNSGGMNLWIVDRAQDNDSHPSENDGKLFELSVPPHPGSGGGPGGSGVSDNFAPRFQERLALDRKRFRVGSGATPVSLSKRKAPRGSRFKFSLSEPARVSIRIQRSQVGRRVGKSCKRRTRSNRKRRRCTRYVTKGTLRRNALQGANRFIFTGRIGRRKLAAARYRASATAEDAAGNTSKASTAFFTIAAG